MSDTPLVRLPRITGGAIYDQETDALLLTFDCSTLEQHDRSATPSSHPVEDGSEITDHVQLSPIVLTIGAIVTTTPLAASIAIEDEQDRDWIAWDDLVRMWREKRLLLIETYRDDYENMVIVNLSNADMEGAPQWLEVSITLQEIEVVESREVDMPPARLDPRVRHNAQNAQNAGRQAAEKEAAAKAEAGEEQAKSLLAQLVDSL